MVESKTGDVKYKVVMLGDSGVGKTCIVTKYVEGTFNEGTLATMGSNFVSKAVTV